MAKHAIACKFGLSKRKKHGRLVCLKRKRARRKRR